jgi:enoyl-[acyl-carrier protein] reductase I
MVENQQFLAGKRALIIGVASKLSIATGIAKALHRFGAELAFSYQGDKLKERVTNIASAHDSNLVFPCDVADDQQIADLFTNLNKSWDKVDIIVHAVAFAPGNELEGKFIDASTREGFKIAHEISSYSFTALAQAAQPMLADNGALLTLSYLGAERSLPNYNVMGLAKASLEASVRYLASNLGDKGIRVNAISAGPIKTLAAKGIKNFSSMLKYNAQQTPLQRNVTTEEVGNTAAFLCSNLASGITGEVIYVDAGFRTTAMNTQLM